MIHATVAEQADATDLKSVGRNIVWVRFPPVAPHAPLAQLVRALDL